MGRLLEGSWLILLCFYLEYTLLFFTLNFTHTCCLLWGFNVYFSDYHVKATWLKLSWILFQNSNPLKNIMKGWLCSLCVWTYVPVIRISIWVFLSVWASMITYRILMIILHGTSSSNFTSLRGEVFILFYFIFPPVIFFYSYIKEKVWRENNFLFQFYGIVKIWHHMIALLNLCITLVNVLCLYTL